jgi:small subunit ribosomal protein S1
MSSPETPPQSPTPDSPEAPAIPQATEASASPVQAERAAAAEPSAHVEAGADADAGDATEGDDSSEGGEEAEAGASPAQDGSAGPAPTGEKKRRRRRRKRKGGAHASDGVASEGASGANGTSGAIEAAEVAEGAEGSGERAEGAPAGQSAKPQGAKKKDKKGPPRERPPVNAGDIVFGKITEVSDDALLVDIPGKAHAIFDRLEMLLPDEEEQRPAAAPQSVSEGEGASEGETASASETAPAPETASAPPSPPPTESVDAPRREPKVPRVILEVGADFIGVVHNDGARGGLVVLTHHPHRFEASKPAVEKAFNEKALIQGLVTGVIKGGIEVDIDGLRAFAPGSHVDLHLGADLSHLVARRLSFHVTQYAKRGRDVVLSRKAMLEEEAKQARTDALSKLNVGEEVDGTVRSVVPFGAFIDVGGIEGLVPLQEMSHNRADGPADVFKVGEVARVKIVRVDERGKVWLSRKATIPDPWQEVSRKYAVGTRHAGKVARIQPFGAFVELESGVDGLIHTQDLSIKRIESPNDVVKVGDAIEVVVAHFDPASRKIGLHPALQGDAANEAPQRVAPHKPLKVKVVTIESGGLVVRALGVTGRNARGYITAAGTGTPRGTELRKVFSVGQEIDAKVIEVDPRRGEVKLSIKALSEDLERNAYQQYRQQLKAEARFTFGDLLAKKLQK